jgi:hypothetical protein
MLTYARIGVSKPYLRDRLVRAAELHIARVVCSKQIYAT